jgi:DNA-binding transcriptional regulator GbsR (MarR family)
MAEAIVVDGEVFFHYWVICLFTFHMVHTTMNHMKSKAAQQDLQKLSLLIGDFIRYWGFRRIHGAIWTQLYLSQNALSGADLTRRLKFSKALVSPALVELEKWGLIKKIKSPDDKTKLYTAVDDVNKVIKHVLKIREQKLIKKIKDQLQDFQKNNPSQIPVDPDRLDQLQQMVLSADMMLNMLLGSNDLMNFPSLIDIK